MRRNLSGARNVRGPEDRAKMESPARKGREGVHVKQS
jgi:hypothetical protein